MSSRTLNQHAKQQAAGQGGNTNNGKVINEGVAQIKTATNNKPTAAANITNGAPKKRVSVQQVNLQNSQPLSSNQSRNQLGSNQRNQYYHPQQGINPLFQENVPQSQWPRPAASNFSNGNVFDACNSNNGFVSARSTNQFQRSVSQPAPPEPFAASYQQRRQSSTVPVKSYVPNAINSGCVTFQYETDGRSTFPVQRDFQDFCKQRDLFYGIKEIWTTQQSESHHKQQQRQSNASIGSFDPAHGKMKTLFQLNTNPTNMNHLASLFLSQCILDTICNGNQLAKIGTGMPPSGTNTAGQLFTTQSAENNVRKFLQSNPSRLEQLRSRVAPNPEASEIDFVQINDPIAFLKYFIGSTATPATFSQYLIDNAVHELTEVENTLEAQGPPTELKDILDLIQKAVLLGKMLGYLFYIPYRTNPGSKSTALTFEQQAALRNYQVPPLDMYTIVLKAVKQNRTVLTLPWVIELLAQADPTVQYLPKYQPIFKLILLVYNQHLRDGKSNLDGPGYQIDSENKRFICLCIKNLLGSIIQGKENFAPDTTDEELKNAMINCEKSETGELASEHLDSQSGIGSYLIPIYFAKSETLKLTSVDEFPPLSSATVPESPFPDRIDRNTSTVAKKDDESNIQAQLEEQFYKSHPVSMKKTVEFVADRVASNFYKNLRSSLLVNIKQELMLAEMFQEEAVIKCKERIKTLRDEFCMERCKGSLRLLLDDNLSEQVKETCISFAVKKASEKVGKWTEQHITKDMFPFVERAEDDEKVVQKSKPSASVNQSAEKPQIIVALAQDPKTAGNGNEDLRHPVLMVLKRTLKKLYNKKELESSTIDQILQSISTIHDHKSFTKNSIISFVISVITFQPNMLTEKQLTDFVQQCKTLFWDMKEDSHKILCSRNLKILGQTDKPIETWAKYTFLLKLLLENEMISLKGLEEYCMTVVLRQDWPSEIAQNISKMLSSLIPRNDGSEEANVINWVEWALSGREDENF